MEKTCLVAPPLLWYLCLTFGEGCHMTRIKIAFVIAAFALSFMTHEANSAPFNAIGAVKAAPERTWCKRSMLVTPAAAGDFTGPGTDRSI